MKADGNGSEGRSPVVVSPVTPALVPSETTTGGASNTRFEKNDDEHPLLRNQAPQHVDPAVPHLSPRSVTSPRMTYQNGGTSVTPQPALSRQPSVGSRQFGSRSDTPMMAPGPLQVSSSLSTDVPLSVNDFCPNPVLNPETDDAEVYGTDSELRRIFFLSSLCASTSHCHLLLVCEDADAPSSPQQPLLRTHRRTISQPVAPAPGTAAEADAVAAALQGCMPRHHALMCFSCTKATTKDDLAQFFIRAQASAAVLTADAPRRSTGTLHRREFSRSLSDQQHTLDAFSDAEAEDSATEANSRLRRRGAFPVSGVSMKPMHSQPSTAAAAAVPPPPAFPLEPVKPATRSEAASLLQGPLGCMSILMGTDRLADPIALSFLAGFLRTSTVSGQSLPCTAVTVIGVCQESQVARLHSELRHCFALSCAARLGKLVVQEAAKPRRPSSEGHHYRSHSGMGSLHHATSAIRFDGTLNDNVFTFLSAAKSCVRPSVETVPIGAPFDASFHHGFNGAAVPTNALVRGGSDPGIRLLLAQGKVIQPATVDRYARDHLTLLDATLSSMRSLSSVTPLLQDTHMTLFAAAAALTSTLQFGDLKQPPGGGGGGTSENVWLLFDAALSYSRSSPANVDDRYVPHDRARGRAGRHVERAIVTPDTVFGLLPHTVAHHVCITEAELDWSAALLSAVNTATNNVAWVSMKPQVSFSTTARSVRNAADDEAPPCLCGDWDAAAVEHGARLVRHLYPHWASEWRSTVSAEDDVESDPASSPPFHDSIEDMRSFGMSRTRSFSQLRHEDSSHHKTEGFEALLSIAGRAVASKTTVPLSGSFAPQLHPHRRTASKPDSDNGTAANPSLQGPLSSPAPLLVSERPAAYSKVWTVVLSTLLKNQAVIASPA